MLLRLMVFKTISLQPECSASAVPPFPIAGKWDSNPHELIATLTN
ncbi:MAG: hypothetical protein QM499_12440 [Flavobacteriaceae bacterium]